MEEDFPGAIASRGYWRVNFRPRSSGDQLGSLQAAEDAVTASVVRLRGWPYPLASSRQGLGSNGIERYDSFLLGWIDWDQHREFWRMYRSSQFLNYRGLSEDWQDRTEIGTPSPYNPGRLHLRALGAIFQVTEFFAFLGRLQERGLYSSGADVQISLRSPGPRILQADESRQIPFIFDKVAHGQDLTYEVSLSAGSVRGVDENSSKALLDLLDKFGWNPPEEQIYSQVRAYLAGRYA